MEQRSRQLYKICCVLGAMLVCFLLLLPSLRWIPADAQTQTLNDVSREHELDAKIQTFFDSLIKGNSTLAFETLLRTGPYESSQASTELRNKIDEIQTQFGSILRYEKLESKRVGEDVMAVRYILKYEHYPIIWTFVFYRKPALTTSLTGNGNSWNIIEVTFDTDMKKLL